MSEGTITPWKPEDAVAQLKERIRLEFAQMIPADQFTAMVRAVITEFTNKKGTGYVQRDKVSDFDQVVINELSEATKTEVQKFLNGPEWKGRWAADGIGGMEASERIGQLLKEHGATILNNWIGQAIQQVLTQLQRR